jgi:hypothetical protein
MSILFRTVLPASLSGVRFSQMQQQQPNVVAREIPEWEKTTSRIPVPWPHETRFDT